jgi:hypothetical protein
VCQGTLFAVDFKERKPMNSSDKPLVVARLASMYPSITKRLFLLLLTAGLAGCISYYKPSTDPSKSANITFVKGVPGRSHISAYNNINCDSSDGFGIIAKVDITTQSVTVPVRANEKMYLRLIGGWTEYGPIMKTTFQCINLASFTPKLGETYQVKQSLKGNACFVSVLNSVTYQEPSDLTLIKTSNSCN